MYNPLFCPCHSAAFSASMVSPHTDEFLDLLASSQSRRLDDQRASASNLPGLRLNQHNSQSVLGHLMASGNSEPDDDFFDILIKCQVGFCSVWYGWLKMPQENRCLVVHHI